MTNAEQNNLLEIFDYTGEGYNRTMNYGEWRVAFLNYAPRFDADNFSKMERHLLTDEVFVLLEGTATLVIGEEREFIEMDKHKLYNVKKGVWHQILVSRDVKILIVENHNTDLSNSEYLEF
ncbi:MAG: hypothetical protein IKA82_02195 [Clostridia bacterium]|nr:hypothetical protein [Clostridia bacterium]